YQYANEEDYQCSHYNRHVCMQWIAELAVFFGNEVGECHPHNHQYTGHSTDERSNIATAFADDTQQEQTQHTSGEDAGKLPPYIEYTFYTNHQYTCNHSQ